MREGRRTGKAKGSHPLSAALWAGLGVPVGLINLICVLFSCREMDFAFTVSLARPVDHIDRGGTQTRHEAFWTHSCVFHSTDSGKHMLNSH